jgi:hypothetical protein
VRDEVRILPAETRHKRAKRAIDGERETDRNPATSLEPKETRRKDAKRAMPVPPTRPSPENPDIKQTRKRPISRRAQK